MLLAISLAVTGLLAASGPQHGAMGRRAAGRDVTLKASITLTAEQVAAFGGPARRPLSERDPEVTDLDPFGREAFIGLTPEQVAAFGGPQVRPLSYPPFDEPEAALKDLSSQLSDAVAANAKAVSELIAAGTALRLERDQVSTALAEVQQKKQLARQLRWRPAKAATASGGGVKATDDGVGGLLAAAAAAAALFFAANPA